MKMIDIVSTSNHNLWRSKLRTSLTILAIFVGAFTLTLTNSLGAGVQQYLNRQVGDVSAPGIFYVIPKSDNNPFAVSTKPKEYNPNKSAHPIDTPSLSSSDLAKLQKVSGVATARPYSVVPAEYATHGTGSKKYVVSTIKPYTSLKLELAAGRLLDVATDQNKVIIPEAYLDVLGFKTASSAINQPIAIGYRDKTGKLAEYNLTVVGVMKSSLLTGSDFFVDDHGLGEIYTLETGTNLSSRFLAAIVQFSDASPDKESTQKSAIEKAGNYSATSLKDQIATIDSVVSAITTGLAVVGIIALLAASFGIINTLLMSVYERTQEVGLMKALGMNRRTVFALFAVEAVLVGFWGSLVAVIVAYGTSQIINVWAAANFLSSFEGFTLLVVTPGGVVFVVGLIMVIAFLAGTLPAVKASRLNPIDALRSE
ncbi:MAG TPA: FtsX-like permease family protein [Candidatus Acidoferrum sp.]|nr:FtsX-like permease family protein [Candidatus Acidoferrum sp.]